MTGTNRKRKKVSKAVHQRAIFDSAKSARRLAYRYVLSQKGLHVCSKPIIFTS